VQTRRVRRLLKLIQALQSGRSNTVEDLVQLTGSSRRTVFRDLELLADAGVSYTFDRSAGRNTTAGAAMLPPVMLTHAEALSLLVSVRYALGRQFATDPTVAASAGLKLESMLPPAIQQHCGRLLERVEIRPGPSSDPQAIVDTFQLLQNALSRSVKIKARYDSYAERAVIDNVLHPHRLVFINRG